MMEIRVWWDWDNTRPLLPWKYYVTIAGKEETGRCNTMADCWLAIDTFVSETVAQSIREARWSG